MKKEYFTKTYFNRLYSTSEQKFFVQKHIQSTYSVRNTGVLLSAELRILLRTLSIKKLLKQCFQTMYLSLGQDYRHPKKYYKDTIT